MNVSEAIERRRSVRAFKTDPVDTALLQTLLEKASRAPSGGNLQPWRIYLLNEEPMRRFRALMEERLAGKAHPDGDKEEYSVYPEKLKEPYRTERYAVGEEMYALLGIPREDKAQRLRWFAENYRFFGAPAGIFCFVDRTMGPPQWSDLGMFLQTFMLLLTEAGLQSCPQECWYRYPKTVADFCSAPEEWMLFCGIAIGYEDPEHPVNRLHTRRMPSSDWLTVM